MNPPFLNLPRCCVCFALVLVLVAPSNADVVVFGDSLSDTGNTSIATFGLIPDPDTGYFQGRFSNGSVWIENLATLLGEPLPIPSRDGGSNFAHGGSEVYLFYDGLHPTAKVHEILAMEVVVELARASHRFNTILTVDRAPDDRFMEPQLDSHTSKLVHTWLRRELPTHASDVHNQALRGSLGKDKGRRQNHWQTGI